MDRLRQENIEQLAKVQIEPAVSIFMPLEQAFDQQDKNRIRLKNLIREAEKGLTEKYALSPAQAEAILEPASDLIAHGRFWSEPHAGLALFLAEKDSSYLYSLPLAVPTTAVVSDQFYLKPLLPMFTHDGRYYLLSLDLENIQLFWGNQFELHEMTWPESIPQNLAEAMQWEDPEKRLQWHSSTAPAPAGDRDAVFHGHGVTGEESQKEDIQRFFHQIDTGVDKLISGENTPLLLIGLDYLIPLYQDANSYPHLLDEAVIHNPQSLSGQEMQEKAWEIVESHYSQEQKEAANNYAQLANTDRASNDLEQVVSGAHYGQVEVLFVAKDQQHWGEFDQMQGSIDIHEDPQPGDSDLLDMAAIQTFLQGGSVYTLPSEEMPDGKPVAAIFRYPNPTA